MARAIQPANHIRIPVDDKTKTISKAESPRANQSALIMHHPVPAKQMKDRTNRDGAMTKPVKSQKDLSARLMAIYYGIEVEAAKEKGQPMRVVLA